METNALAGLADDLEVSNGAATANRRGRNERGGTYEEVDDVADPGVDAAGRRVAEEIRDDEIGVTYSMSEEAGIITFNFRLDETGFEVHGIEDRAADPHTLCMHSNIALTAKDRKRVWNLSMKLPRSEDGTALDTLKLMLLGISQFPDGEIVDEDSEFSE